MKAKDNLLDYLYENETFDTPDYVEQSIKSVSTILSYLTAFKDKCGDIVNRDVMHGLSDNLTICANILKSVIEEEPEAETEDIDYFEDLSEYENLEDEDLLEDIEDEDLDDYACNCDCDCCTLLGTLGYEDSFTQGVTDFFKGRNNEDDSDTINIKVNKSVSQALFTVVGQLSSVSKMLSMVDGLGEEEVEHLQIEVDGMIDTLNDGMFEYLNSAAYEAVIES